MRHPAAPENVEPRLSSDPFSRLALPKQKLTALRAPFDDSLRRRGVKSVRAFMAESPSVMLVVYEFASERELFAEKGKIVALKPAPRSFMVSMPPPFYAEAVSSGRWLLVAGFPAEKPPSPEMKRAKTQFLRAFE